MLLVASLIDCSPHYWALSSHTKNIGTRLYFFIGDLCMLLNTVLVLHRNALLKESEGMGLITHEEEPNSYGVFENSHGINNSPPQGEDPKSEDCFKDCLSSADRQDVSMPDSRGPISTIWLYLVVKPKE